ncbi:M20 family metallo-hydrolase [Sporosarcina sp. ACRSM]|uniref:M20 family metallo-hydrolase n=1 Tax=Sporosarcina sp. ACRSM TaxID=2918216 RepID=UPI0021056E4B|nr:M20 family metallo-hydrolase [Sporosarcina sp. ACRSM]
MDLITLWLEEKLLALNGTTTMNRPDGFTRLGFSLEEKKAHSQFAEIAEELGLITYQDEAGNRWAVWEVDQQAPTIAMGSHLDTVHSGGGYDGLAGVLCALAAVKQLKDCAFRPKKNIAVISFISEESARFGISTIGSKAIIGELHKAELAPIQDSDGITVTQAMEDYGIDWDRIEQAEVPRENLEFFLELHIEQGSILEKNHYDIGVVKGIACPIRLIIRAQGTANHTGTTPMDERKDAFVAIAPLVTFVYEEALKMNENNGSTIVATVSKATLKPNAMNVIPSEVELGIDIRSVDDDLKRIMKEKIIDFCQQVEQKHPVTVEVQTLVNNDSVLLDEAMQTKLLQVSERLGYKTMRMDSGAGHDVMNMAKRWPSGLLFIPCRDGLSHHPKEFTSIENLEKGTHVLVEFLRTEA